MKKKIAYILILISAVAMLGCGSSTNSYYDNATEAATAFEEAEYETGFSTTTESMMDNKTVSVEAPNKKLYEEKLIYTGNLNIETLEYEKTIAGIKELANRYNAIISYENETDTYYDWYDYGSSRGSKTRYNSMCLRVPSDYYFEFVEKIGNIGVITNKSHSVDNITNEYYDVATQIQSLKKQEERLLKMYDECQTIEDMIAVEKRLNEVQSELSGYQTRLDRMDMDVAYSYVYLNIEEVVELSKTNEPVKTNTFKDRLINTIIHTKDSTLRGLENFLFGIIENIVLIVVIVVIYIIFRKRIKSVFKSLFTGVKLESKENKSNDKDDNEQE